MLLMQVEVVSGHLATVQIPAFGQAHLGMHHFHQLTLPQHARTRPVVVQVAAMGIANLMEHLIRAVGQGFAQPVFKNNTHIAIQPHDSMTDSQRPGIGGRLDQGKYFVVVETGNHGRHHDKYGYAGPGEGLYGAQALLHRSGARLQELT